MLSLLPFLLIILVFWFLIIRPQQKRQRAAQEMQSELSPGSQVMLTSGIFGTVSEITDDHVAIEVADGVQIKVIRAAIGRVLPEDFGQDAADADDDTDVEHDAYGSSDESVEETLQKYTPQPVQQPEKND